MSDTDVRKGGAKYGLRTNLILRDGITDVLDQVTEFIYILSVVQELRDLALLRQRDEFFENVIQFPFDNRVRLARDLGKPGHTF
jgi:hypothetical protein